MTGCNTYTWDCQAYTTSRAYNNTYTNVAGCDSIHTLNLTINYSDTTTDIQQACDSYTWIDGIIYTTSNNSATFLYQTIHGCDSLVILDLTMNYSNTGSSVVTACNTYTWDGQAYTTSGAYNNTYTNVAGCNSIHTLNLTINYSNTGSSVVTACNTYTWDGQA